MSSSKVGLIVFDRQEVIALDAADEKNREGNDIVLRSDLADDLRRWLADRLAAMHEEAKAKGGQCDSCSRLRSR